VRVAITINNAGHQKTHAAAMRQGLEKHGHAVCFVASDWCDGDADVHVTWSIKRPQLWAWHQATGKPVLVMERGHVGDRMAYTSCGWNGLGHRGQYPTAQDGGARWRERFAALTQPWQTGGDYALLVGQVPTDSAVDGLALGFEMWAQFVTDILAKQKRRVRFRPHPIVRTGGDSFCPRGAEYSDTPALAEDLQQAALCVTYNSTSGVEAVLAGVPTVTIDEGAMAWPVTSHSCIEPKVMPDREAWAHDLAWTQWTLEEIASGEAWAHLEPMIR
jgi:hypothetical protein